MKINIQLLKFIFIYLLYFFLEKKTILNAELYFFSTIKTAKIH